MKQSAPEFRDVSMEELAAILESVRAHLSEEDHATLGSAIQMLVALAEKISAKDASIAELRAFLAGKKSEKRAKIGNGKPKGPASSETRSDGEGQGDGQPEKEKQKRKGHGRNGQEEYTGARRFGVEHETLNHGDCCPACQRGRVYRLKKPRASIRIFGQPPIMAEIAELETFRCNSCGDVFTAKAPPGFDEKKYDETAGSMAATLKYGTGVPFHRLERLQDQMGVPLAAGNQWDLVEEVAEVVAPVHDEFVRQAAQGTVIHTDDTNMLVIELAAAISKGAKIDANGDEADEAIGKERTGIFTTGLVSEVEGDHRIALYFTGRRHAGENGRDVLHERDSALAPPIMMFDGSSRNLPKGLEVIVANCIVHARRYFVKLVDAFPTECLHVIDELALVYEVDERAKELGLSKRQRLRLHRAESKPVMDRLYAYMTDLIESKRVEPNSGLGKAIAYMTTRWDAMTLFLELPGAPLDNNIAERALKKAILNRKNAYFYKTQNGAHVGDILMSLIHTAELAEVNPFDYLTELQRHANEIRVEPGSWMPWNYRATLDRLREPQVGHR